jgi:DNA-binding NarL/FixJ family response regulator
VRILTASNIIPPISVAVIDSRTLGREALIRCFELYGNHLVAVGHSSIHTWLPFAQIRPANVVLLFLSDPQRLDIRLGNEVASIRQASPRSKIIIVSDTECSLAILLARGIVVEGYLGPRNSFSDMAILVRQLHLASPAYLKNPTPVDSDSAPDSRLTSREHQIVIALREGCSNSDIARSLSLSEMTVKTHLKNIRNKLNARNRAHIVHLMSESIRRASPVAASSPTSISEI